MAAQKRMFALDIINAGEFLDLSPAAQALYFQIAMRADDDGFLKVSKRLLAYVGESDAELKELTKAGFLLSFDGGVYAVRHWRLHNNIRKERKRPTTYKNELAQIKSDGNVYILRTSDGQLTDSRQTKDNRLTDERQTADRQTTDERPQNVNIGARQNVNIDKNSIDKNSIDKYRTVDPYPGTKTDVETVPETAPETEPEPTPEASQAEPYNPENDPNTIKGKIKAIREEREKQKKFTPPTLEMVKAYCEERGNGINAEQFIDYYTANGWTQGKGKPIKDWQACVRTWERNGYHGTGGTYNGTNGTPDGETYTNYYPQYAGNDLDKLEPITPADGEKLPFQ